MYLYVVKRIVTVMFICALVVLTLSGCINNASSQPSKFAGTSPTAEPLASITGSQVPSSTSSNQNKSFRLSSLDIQASPFACPMDAWLYSYGIKYSGENVILANKNASFDDGAIAHLTDSINQDNPSLLPKGFATAMAGFVGPNYGYSACEDDLEITNTGQSPIQITQMALLYTANSRSNPNHYDFIDICSLPIQLKDKICWGGRGGRNDFQIYSFKIPPGSRNTIISSQERSPLSIDPEDTIKVKLLISPADVSNPNYIYSVVPQITLNTSFQAQNLSLLASEIVFADSSLASCYQLRSNNTFRQMNNPTLPVGSGVPDSQGIIVFPECV